METTTIIQQLYVAYYGRPADPNGLEYWTGRLEDNGGNLGEVIHAFAASTEFDERFGNLSDEELVGNLYQQIFGREVDDVGLEFYTGMLERGDSSLIELALDITNGAQGTDSVVIQKRVEVAEQFTQELTERGLRYGAEEIEAASQVVAGVTPDTDVAAYVAGAMNQALESFPPLDGEAPGDEDTGGGGRPTQPVDPDVYSFEGVSDVDNAKLDASELDDSIKNIEVDFSNMTSGDNYYATLQNVAAGTGIRVSNVKAQAGSSGKATVGLGFSEGESATSWDLTLDDNEAGSYYAVNEFKEKADTVNIHVGEDNDGTLLLAGNAQGASNVKNITVDGAGALAFQDYNYGNLESLDASAATGDISFGNVDKTGGNAKLSLQEDVTIKTGSGNDRIDLSSIDKNVTVDGGAGDDTIIVGAGDKTLTGGEGADTFVITADATDNSSRPVVTDYSFEDGDVIDLSGVVYPEGNIGLLGNLEFRSGASEGVPGTEKDFVIELVGNEIGGSTDGSVIVLEGSADSNIRLYLGEQFMGESFEAIVGRGDGREIKGDSEDFQFLIGGDGSQTIISGAGNSGMIGGTGKDTFVFKEGMGNNIIYDWTQGEDTIDLSAFEEVSFSDIIIPGEAETDSGELTLISEKFDGSITLVGVNSELNADDFSFFAPA